MKKFLKILRKFIKFLLLTLLGIILFLIAILLIFNNRYFKYYDGYKITFNEYKQINNGYEIYYNLKTSNIIFKELKKGDIYLFGNFDINYNNTNYLLFKLLLNRLFGKNSDNKLHISGNINRYYQDNIIEGETIINCEYSKTDKSCILNNTGYYENGNLKAILNIKKSSELGEEYNTLNWFNENGKLESKENYKNGVLDGEYFEYYENGNLKTEGNYKDGKLLGIQTGYYESGQISSVCNYVNGYKSGECNTYYKNSQIRDNGEYKVEKIGYYNKDNNEPLFHSYGTHTYYYDNGDFLGNFNEICNLKSGDICAGSKKIGIMEINYYPSLKIKEKIFYENYKHYGKYKEILYYENGNIKEEGSYKNELKNGIWTEYYENGKLKAEGNYENGEKTGIWTEYYVNGNLKAEGNYENGEKIGIRNGYLLDGSIGVSKNYDENIIY